jgi:four helix bundle protein
MADIEANRQLEERTLNFAVAVIRFVTTFDRSEAAFVVGRQLLKSSTSIGANYREANRAESREDSIHKTSIVVKEASETDYWMELCTRPRHLHND